MILIQNSFHISRSSLCEVTQLHWKGGTTAIPACLLSTGKLPTIWYVAQINNSQTCPHLCPTAYEPTSHSRCTKAQVKQQKDPEAFKNVLCGVSICELKLTLSNPIHYLIFWYFTALHHEQNFYKRQWVIYSLSYLRRHISAMSSKGHT